MIFSTLFDSSTVIFKKANCYYGDIDFILNYNIKHASAKEYVFVTKEMVIT